PWISTKSAMRVLPYEPPPVTSMVSPVTKSASAEARKQITRAWSTASATRRSGVLSISAALASWLPLPMRADALGQRDARRDRVDGDAVRPQLVAELLGEGDDAALGRGVGGRGRD